MPSPGNLLLGLVLCEPRPTLKRRASAARHYGWSILIKNG